MRLRESIDKHLRYTKWYVQLVGLLEKVHLRGGQADLQRVLIIFLDRVSDNRLLERAYGVAFNFTLSLFPAIIFLFALIPFLHMVIPSISQGEILHFLEDILPPDFFEFTAETIYDTVQIRREGLISFGVLFALYLATNGVAFLMKAFNSSYRTSENRSLIKTRLIALGLTVLLAMALIVAILLLLIGQLMLDWLLNKDILTEDFTYYVIIFLRFMVIFIAFYLAVASIYFWGPAIHDKWRFFSMGSFLSSLLCVLVSFGFSMYVTNFGTYNKVYGSIGTMMAMMIWQYLMAVVLLLGFEFNASIDRAVAHRKKSATRYSP